MVNLTRIYTKTGDDGTTSLGDMSRTSKNDPRLEAYATVDEANSAIGVVLSTDQLADAVRALLVRIQNDLFDVGADLCTPVVDAPAFEPLRVLETQVHVVVQKLVHQQLVCKGPRQHQINHFECALAMHEQHRLIDLLRAQHQ